MKNTGSPRAEAGVVSDDVGREADASDLVGRLVGDLAVAASPR